MTDLPALALVRLDTVGRYVTNLAERVHLEKNAKNYVDVKMERLATQQMEDAHAEVDGLASFVKKHVQ